jgi:hypothetical protein
VPGDQSNCGRLHTCCWSVGETLVVVGGRVVIKEAMSLVRINDIEDDVSPRQLRKILKRFGEVGNISVHAGGNLVYGLAEMRHDDAVELFKALEEDRWQRGRGHGVGPVFTAEMANPSKKPWLSHEWRPMGQRKEDS